jgi:membrane protein YqaA with SNARE-associated domain
LLKSIADALIAFGPFGVLAICFLDSAGVPLPSVLDVALITFAIRTPQQAYFMATLAVVGSLAGNYALFHAARYGGNRWMKADAPDSKREKFRHWFARYGLLTVFIPALVPFIPLPLKVFVASAGAMRTPTSRFLLVILVARVIRYFGEAYLAMRLGEDTSGFLTHNAWSMAAVVLTMALALILAIKWYDRRLTAPTP